MSSVRWSIHSFIIHSFTLTIRGFSQQRQEPFSSHISFTMTCLMPPLLGWHPHFQPCFPSFSLLYLALSSSQAQLLCCFPSWPWYRLLLLPAASPFYSISLSLENDSSFSSKVTASTKPSLPSLDGIKHVSSLCIQSILLTPLAQP